jgi:hypothetical protein
MLQLFKTKCRLVKLSAPEMDLMSRQREGDRPHVPGVFWNRYRRRFPVIHTLYKYKVFGGYQTCDKMDDNGLPHE